MAAAVIKSRGGYLSPNRQDPRSRLIIAQQGGNRDSDFELRRILNPGLVNHVPGDFQIRCTTDSNDAASASNVAVNLSSNGFTIASGFIALDEERELYCSVLAASGSTRYRIRTRQRVGVDPNSGQIVLIGQLEYTQNLIARYVVDTSGSTATGIAQQSAGPAWHGGTGPQTSGAVASGSFRINLLGVTGPAGSEVPLGVTPVPTGVTGPAALTALRDAQPYNYQASYAQQDISGIPLGPTGSAVGFAAGLIKGADIILPPITPQWFIDTTTTPTAHQLVLCPVGLANDLVTWDITVAVGDAIYMPLL